MDTSLAIIFVTGLTTGGLSCVAMQGGLLTSLIANQNKYRPTNQSHQSLTSKFLDQSSLLPITAFLITKLLSHTILGFMLGLLGSQIAINQTTQLAFQIFTALFMFATALNLLNIHPIFRYVVFQPPKFLNKYIKSTSNSQSLFAPILLGILTIFIPCGVTQAMEISAINSANPITGALIMFSFILGTIPIFTLLGVISSKLTTNLYTQFTKLTAYALILLSIYTANASLTVLNSPITLQTITNPIHEIFFYTPPTQSQLSNNSNLQQIAINVLNNGYSPNYIQVRQNIPVQLTLISNNTYSCSLSFILKEFNINTFLQSNDSQSFTFTPTQKGKYTYTCSMGMYTGTLEVI